MKVFWTAEALQNRADIWDYLAINSLPAAKRMDERFDEAADKLVAFSQLGRPGTIPGTRELIPHANYRLVYTIIANTVWIVALLHTSRQRPPPWT